MLNGQAVFTLIDICGLTFEQAIASLVDTARAVTEAAHERQPGRAMQAGGLAV